MSQFEPYDAFPQLKDLLKEHEIDSIASLRNALATSKRALLKEETQESLRLDGEYRTYDEDVNIRYLFIKSNFSAQNSKTIEIIDTVIDGSILISDKSKKLTNINLDNIIISGTLTINAGKSKKISLYRVNCKKVIIRGIEDGEITISNSNIFDLSFESCHIDETYCNNNEINKLVVSESIFKKTNFDHSQINTSLLLLKANSKQYKKELEKFKLFNFLDKSNTEESNTRWSNNDTKETIDFLINNTNIDLDREKLSKLRAAQSKLYSSHSKLSYLFMCSMGHFTKPHYFVHYYISIFLLFSLIFTYLGLDFSISGSEERQLSFMESIYFSGITMTTIGYGDIAPLGLARILATIEGTLGTITMSAFIVSLYRKYVES